MALHERLKQLRVDSGLSLKNLSDHTGLSVSYLSDIERGRTVPSLGTLIAIADAHLMTVVAILSAVDLGELVTLQPIPFD